jgi:hypothetical protein
MVDKSWKVISEAGTGNIVEESLQSGALDMLDIQFTGTGEGEIILKIQPDILNRNMVRELSEQGYRLSISPGYGRRAVSQNAVASGKRNSFMC